MALVPVSVNVRPDTETIARDAARSARLSFGEQIEVSTFNVIAVNGAEELPVANVPPYNGFLIPGGLVSTGGNSLVAAVFPIAADLAAELAGSIVRVIGTFEATADFLTAKPPTANHLRKSIVENTAITNVAGDFGSTSQVGTVITRQALYTMVGDEDFLGILYQLPTGGSAPAATVAEHSIVLKSLVFMPEGMSSARLSALTTSDVSLRQQLLKSIQENPPSLTLDGPTGVEIARLLRNKRTVEMDSDALPIDLTPGETYDLSAADVTGGGLGLEYDVRGGGTAHVNCTNMVKGSVQHVFDVDTTLNTKVRLWAGPTGLWKTVIGATTTNIATNKMLEFPAGARVRVNRKRVDLYIAESATAPVQDNANPPVRDHSLLAFGASIAARFATEAGLGYFRRELDLLGITDDVEIINGTAGASSATNIAPQSGVDNFWWDSAGNAPGPRALELFTIGGDPAAGHVTVVTARGQPLPQDGYFTLGYVEGANMQETAAAGKITPAQEKAGLLALFAWLRDPARLGAGFRIFLDTSIAGDDAGGSPSNAQVAALRAVMLEVCADNPTLNVPGPPQYSNDRILNDPHPTYGGQELPGRGLGRLFVTSRLPVTGVSAAVTASTVTLAASASAVNNFYTGRTLEIAGQARRIFAYVGSTRVASVTPALSPVPAAGTTYVVRPAIGPKIRPDGVTRNSPRQYTVLLDSEGQGFAELLALPEGFAMIGPGLTPLTTTGRYLPTKFTWSADSLDRTLILKFDKDVPDGSKLLYPDGRYSRGLRTQRVIRDVGGNPLQPYWGGP